MPEALIGRWTCEGYFVAFGKALASTIEIDRGGAPGTWLVHHVDRAPGRYSATELWSFPAVGLPLRAAIAGAGPMRYYSSPGWTGNAITWSRQGADEQFVYILTGDVLQVDWLTARAGAPLTLGDRLSCRRAAR